MKTSKCWSVIFKFSQVCLPLYFAMGLGVFSDGTVLATNFDFSDAEAIPLLESEGLEAENLEESNEPKQEDLRMARLNGIGIGLGEIVPQEVISVHAFHILGEKTGLGISLGGGNFRVMELQGEDNSFVNKVHTVILDSSYYYWPSQSFPFVLSSGLGLKSTTGKTTTFDGEVGTYKLYSVGLGVGLGIHTIFENGIWINWQILSMRYGHLLKSSYSSMDPEQKNIIRTNGNKLQVSGVANIVVGYAL